MNKMTDLLSVGTAYTVADVAGNIIQSVQVLTHTDILDAALGPYTSEFGSYESYLKKSIKVLSGFSTNFTSVLWYSTHDEEIVLSDVIEYAVLHGYDSIILEHLDDQDEFDIRND
jgi:hypothetical protein